MPSLPLRCLTAPHVAPAFLLLCGCSAVKTTISAQFIRDVFELSADSNVGMHGVTHQFWWVGALATMVGATLTIIGLMIQKTAHAQIQGQDSRYYWVTGRWCLGFSVWMGGQLICWTADGLANRSLLACFNCWNIVVVFVLAPWYLGECVVRMAGVGATLTLVGCIWVVLTGPRSFHTQTVDTLQESWLNPAFLALLGISFCMALALAFWAKWRANRTSPLVPVLLSALSAIFAWYAVLLSKCASTLTVTSVRAKSQFGHWQFWLYLVLMAGFAVCQVHVLNMALRLGTAVGVLPVYESLSMLGQVIICGVFFREFRGFTLEELAHFAVAIGAVLIGIVVMALASKVAEKSERANESLPFESDQYCERGDWHLSFITGRRNPRCS